jgi:hypothetical protein
MNGLIFLVASSLAAASDPMPAPVAIPDPTPTPAPVCATPCPDPYKTGFFQRLMLPFDRATSSWGCMPCVVGHPAPQYHYEPVCTCTDNCKPGCLDKFRARINHTNCAACGNPPCDGGDCPEIPTGGFIANRYGPTPGIMPYLTPTIIGSQGGCKACKGGPVETSTSLRPKDGGQPTAAQAPELVKPAAPMLPASINPE